MKALIAAASFFGVFSGFLARAGTALPAFAPCASWPAIVSASGPDLAAAGLPFTLNFRFDCLLGDSFSITGLKATYEEGAGSAIGYSGEVFPFPLPAGDTLYQLLFKVRQGQPGGTYRLSGCLELRRRDTGETRCLDVPEQTLVIVAGPGT